MLSGGAPSAAGRRSEGETGGSTTLTRGPCGLDPGRCRGGCRSVAGPDGDPDVGPAASKCRRRVASSPADTAYRSTRRRIRRAGNGVLQADADPDPQDRRRRPDRRGRPRREREPAGTVGSRPPAGGWYRQSAAPGTAGNAVIDGHVDGLDGPAVFYSLGALHKGDTIEITRADRSIAEFTADAVEVYPKDAVPADRVFGAADQPQLRLVTCGGAYTKATGYQGTVIVYGRFTQAVPAS
ncbi:sortase domain-bontaining protein [Kitasatospora arboriphila]